MNSRWAKVAAISLPLAAYAGSASPQTSPTPGPTNPVPGPPVRTPSIVINPTEEQCRNGWNQTLPWTRQQFQEFCLTLRSAK